MPRKVILWPHRAKSELPGWGSLFGNGFCNCLFPHGRAFASHERLRRKGIHARLVTPVFCRVFFFSGEGLAHSRELRESGASQALEYGQFQRWQARRSDLLEVMPHPSIRPERSLDQDSPPHGICSFRRTGQFFQDVIGHEQRIRDEIRDLLRWDELPAEGGQPIAVPIRRGDFVSYDISSEAAANALGTVDDYRESVAAARKSLGDPESGVNVSSDSPNDPFVQEFCEEVGGTIIGDPAPFASLRLMGESSILVASCSTFSAWAGFLSNVSTIFQRDYEWLGIPEEPTAEAWVRGSAERVLA